MSGIFQRPNLRLNILLIGWLFALGFMFAAESAEALTPGQNEDFKACFKGRLGQYPVELFIEKQNSTVSGRYIQRFKSGQRSIELTGYIDAQGQIHLNGKGIFTGRMEGDTFEGVWYRSEDSREQYPFTLTRKDPDYNTESFWQRKTLETGGQLDLPRDAGIKAVSSDSLFSGRWARLHPLEVDAFPVEGAYRIQLPVEDTSIVSGFSLELGVYADADSIKQLLENDSSYVCGIRELELQGKKVELMSYEEGTTSGSHHSNFYFYRLPEQDRAYLFHLFYSYTNPWIYGNPYSKDDYQGPYINDMNRLIEIVEMIVTSG